MTNDESTLDADRIDAAALALVGIVHGDGSRQDVAQLVRRLDRTDLIGLAISLAALVDPDRSPDELLAWIPTTDPSTLVAPGWTDAAVKKAHSDYQRNIRDERTKAGEAVYRKLWNRRQLSPTEQKALAAARMPITA